MYRKIAVGLAGLLLCASASAQQTMNGAIIRPGTTPINVLQAVPPGAVICNPAGSSAIPTACTSLPAQAIPVPTPSTLGGVTSNTPAAHQFVTGINTSGGVTTAQPAAGDVSGLAPLAASGSASDLVGVVPAANGGAGTVSGLLKANGSGTVSAAVPGTDYLTPSGSGAALTGLTVSQVSGAAHSGANSDITSLSALTPGGVPLGGLPTQAPFSFLGNLSATVSSPSAYTSYSAFAADQPPNLPNWRLCLANTRAGNSDCDALVISDSTGWGFSGSGAGTPTRFNTWVAKAAAMISATGVPATLGLDSATPPGTIPDTSWSLGSGWTQPGNAGPGQGAVFQWSNGASNTTWTPGIYSDTYDIIYSTNPSNGTVTATATGGSGTVINEAATAGFASVTITAPTASVSNVVTFSAPTGGGYIYAVRARLSTQKRLLFDNISVSGSHAYEWVGTGTFGPINYIKFLAPKLCIIQLGINDASAGQTPAQLGANLTTIANACKISGDVIFVTMPPSSGSQGTTEATYIPQIYAQIGAGLVVDEFNRLGGIYQAAMMGDTVHPNSLGYWDMADGFVSRLGLINALGGPSATALQGSNNLFDVANPYLSSNNLGAIRLSNLQNLRVALSSLRAQTADLPVAVIGDTSTQGWTGSGAINNANSWVTQAAAMVNGGAGVYASNGMGVCAAPGQTPDTRWSMGSGWTQGQLGVGPAQGAVCRWTNAAASTVFTPGVLADTYDIVYNTSSGLGTVTATATGGSDTVINENGVAGFGTVTITAASASASNTVTLSSPTGAGYIYGIRPRLSTKKQLIFDNIAVSSSLASDWANSSGAFASTNFIKYLAPKLCVIALGVADGASSTAAATFATNLATVIAACKVSGDVVLLTPPPSSGAAGTFQASYVPLIYSAANVGMVVDEFNRMGGAYNSTFMGNANNPNFAGYSDEASNFIARWRLLDAL